MASVDRFIQGGFMIYPRGTFGTNYYIFNKVIGNMPDVSFKENYNKTTLKTFGKYPAIFYVGNTQYKTFSLQTVFTSDQDMYNYGKIIPEGSQISQTEDMIIVTAYDAYISFKRQIEQRIPWVVRGSVSGEDFICDIEITSTAHNQNSIIRKGGNVEQGRETCGPDDGMNGLYHSYTSGDIFFSDYIQVTIECTEIDDYIYPDPNRGISGDGPEDRFNVWGES